MAFLKRIGEMIKDIIIHEKTPPIRNYGVIGSFPLHRREGAVPDRIEIFLAAHGRAKPLSL